MANYITGYGKSLVKVYDSTYLRTYELPLCNPGGLNEENIFVQNINELESGTLSQRFFGIRKKFTLDYSNYIVADDILELIQPLIDDYISGLRLIFYPKANNLNYNYEVLITNPSILIAMIRNKSTTAGMQGIVIEFTTKYYVQTPGWLDADYNGSGYFGISTQIE